MKENKTKAAKSRGALLLARAKQAKQKETDKNFDKLVGKRRNNAKFDKVNFNG